MGRLQFSSPSFSSSAILQTIAGVIAEPSTYSCGTVPLYLLLLLLTRLAITKAGRCALSAVIFELEHGLLREWLDLGILARCTAVTLEPCRVVLPCAESLYACKARRYAWG